jgi:hypothetical protein
MVDRLIETRNADPNGELVVQIFETTGFVTILRTLFQPTRSIDIPTSAASDLCKTVKIELAANQRAEVFQDGKIILQG